MATSVRKIARVSLYAYALFRPTSFRATVMVRFSACQSVTISVPEQPRSIEDYLSEPSRLVCALLDEQQVERIHPNLFRVRMKPIKFLSLSVRPVSDIRVWCEDDVVRLSSDRCVVEGYEAFNERFAINMQGYLLVQQMPAGKTLRGQANLGVSVDLPQALKLTPKPLLERTGNGLINGILITLKQRLMRQLIEDYGVWAASSSTASSSTVSASTTSSSHEPSRRQLDKCGTNACAGDKSQV